MREGKEFMIMRIGENEEELEMIGEIG